MGTLQKIFAGETENPRYATRQALENALVSEYKYEGTPQNVEESSFYETSAVSPKVKKQGEYTLEDYYTLPDDRRVELIDGVIYDMYAPTFVHQEILGEMYSAIKDYIRTNNGNCLPMMGPVDVRLDCDDRTIVQPDVLILCDRSKICKWGIMGAPDFCLEIISETTGRKDYTKKLQKYTDAGVKEYWILDPLRKLLFTYCWKDDYVPHMYALEGKVGLALYDGKLQIDLDQIAPLIQEYPEGGRD